MYSYIHWLHEGTIPVPFIHISLLSEFLYQGKPFDKTEAKTKILLAVVRQPVGYCLTAEVWVLKKKKKCSTKVARCIHFTFTCTHLTVVFRNTKQALPFCSPNSQFPMSQIVQRENVWSDDISFQTCGIFCVNCAIHMCIHGTVFYQYS